MNSVNFNELIKSITVDMANNIDPFNVNKLNNLQKLNDLLIKARDEYYNKNNQSFMTDAVYDHYERILKKAIIDDPTLEGKIENLVTNTVGSPVDTINSFSKTYHLSPMISLDNVFNIDEFNSWANNVLVKTNNGIFGVELKFDGLAIDIIYENGLMVRACTRGDGIVGEDITANALTIMNIPKYISVLDRVNIRGEVIIKKSHFDEMNKSLQDLGLEPMANPRNAAAGSLRLLSPLDAANRPLSFIPYEVVNGSNHGLHSHTMARSWLIEHGFEVPPYYCESNAVMAIECFYQDILRDRVNLDYPIDGIVIKIDSYLSRSELGENRRIPYWAIAYKFPSEVAIAVLLDVIWQVGRTGKLTPVAIFKEPVTIFGASISRCTLNNASEIKRLKLQYDDLIKVERSGDVIPKIIGKFTGPNYSEFSFKPKIHIPSNCPTCDSVLVNRDEGIHLYCKNATCLDVQQRQIEYWASKSVMNIMGLGESIVKELYGSGNVLCVSDLYNLKNIKDKLYNIPGFGTELINKIVDSIESTRNPPINKFIAGLCIDGVAEVTANKIASQISDISEFVTIALNPNDSISKWGLGNVVAKQLADYVNINYNYILDLEQVIGTCTTVKIELFSDKLIGKTFCITGSFEKYSRDEIKATIIGHGGTVVDNVTGKTNALVCGENAGSKLEKARKHHIPIYLNKWVDILMSNNHEELEIPK